MANNYLLFSQEIREITPEEDDWLHRRYEDGPVEDDLDSYDFEARRVNELNGNRTLWILAQESGNPEHVAEFVQEFLGKFRPKEIFTLTWAEYCDKPRIGKFGGGALVVTAQAIRFMTTWQWAKENHRQPGEAEPEQMPPAPPQPL